jgi:phosphopantothenoylcysteine decarboxylase/phosphopantothenate--cysteine ligase
MAAAVADYRPRRRLAGKFEKRDGPLRIELVRNPDIVAGLARTKGRRIVGGFALEAKAGLGRARRKLARKNLDFIVLNRVATLGSDEIEATVLYANARRGATPLSGRKADVAKRIVRILEDLHAGREGALRGPEEVGLRGRRRRRQGP